VSEPLDLAASIRANTAAVQALTAIINRLFPTERIAIPRDSVLVIPKVREDAAAEDAAFAAIKTETAPPAASEVTLDDVKAAAVKLAKRDREALAAVLKDFKAAKVVDLKPEQYAEFHKHIRGGDITTAIAA
jgi:hypothetical protein